MPDSNYYIHINDSWFNSSALIFIHQLCHCFKDKRSTPLILLGAIAFGKWCKCFQKRPSFQWRKNVEQSFFYVLYLFFITFAEVLVLGQTLSVTSLEWPKYFVSIIYEPIIVIISHMWINLIRESNLITSTDCTQPTGVPRHKASPLSTLYVDTDLSGCDKLGKKTCSTFSPTGIFGELCNVGRLRE